MDMSTTGGKCMFASNEIRMVYKFAVFEVYDVDPSRVVVVSPFERELHSYDLSIIRQC